MKKNSLLSIWAWAAMFFSGLLKAFGATETNYSVVPRAFFAVADVGNYFSQMAISPAFSNTPGKGWVTIINSGDIDDYGNIGDQPFGGATCPDTFSGPIKAEAKVKGNSLEIKIEAFSTCITEIGWSEINLEWIAEVCDADCTLPCAEIAFSQEVQIDHGVRWTPAERQIITATIDKLTPPGHTPDYGWEIVSGPTQSPSVFVGSTNGTTVQIQIGKEIGQLVLNVKDHASPNPDCSLSTMLDIREGCSSCSGGSQGTCVGTAQFQNSCVSLSLPLGQNESGAHQGSIELFSLTPSGNLGNPSSLQLKSPGTNVISGTNGLGVLTNVLCPSGLFVVGDAVSNSYDIEFYSREQVVTNEGGFSTTGEPVIRYEISYANTEPETLSIVEKRDDTITKAAQYVWQEDNSDWDLVEGNGLRTTRRRTVELSATNYVEITEIFGPDEEIVSVSTETFEEVSGGGIRLVASSVGSGDDERTTIYTYTNNLIESVVSPTSWEWTVYDGDGRLDSVYKGRDGTTPGPTDTGNHRTSYSYVSLNDSDDDTRNANKPRTISEYFDGQLVAKRAYIIQDAYEVEYIFPDPAASLPEAFTGTNYESSAYGQTITEYYFGGPNKDRIKRVRQPNLVQRQYAYYDLGNTFKTETLEGVWLTESGRFDVHRRTDVRSDARGMVFDTMIYDETDLFLGGRLLSRAWKSNLDEFGRYLVEHFDDGTSNVVSYGCCYVESQTDRSGIVTTFDYDLLGRTLATTRDGITTSTIYDAVSRVIATYRTGTNDIEQLQNGTLFDTAGRALAMTNALEQVTLMAESDGAVSGVFAQTNTLPDDTTEETYLRLDGSLLRRAGTAVHGVRYESGVTNFGGVLRKYEKTISLLTNGSDSAEWTMTVIDGRGRTIHEVTAVSTNTSVYNDFDQLVRSVDADGVTTLYQYDPWAGLEYTAIDVNTNDVIDFDGMDRISRRAPEAVVTDGDSYFFVSSNFVWQVMNNDTTRLTSQNKRSTNGLESWNTVNGLTNYSLTEYLGSGYVRNQRTGTDGTISWQETYAGRIIQSVVTNPVVGLLSKKLHYYDEFNRLKDDVDELGRTNSYTYDALDRVVTMTGPADGSGNRLTTTNLYDLRGRVVRTDYPDGTFVTNSYLPTGEILRSTGSRTYPVEYSYDHAGRMKTLTTWKNYSTNGGAAVTTWEYEVTTGRLLSKMDAADRGPVYNYTAAGRLKTREWARTNNLTGEPLTTTYGYNTAGDLVSIDYDDNTLDVTNAIDRAGRSVGSGNAAVGLSMAYTTEGLLQQESLRVTNYVVTQSKAYDGLLRLTNTLLPDINHQIGYAYDAASRLVNVMSGGLRHQYGYQSGSSRLMTLTRYAGTEPVFTTTHRYDHLGQVTNLTSTGGGINDLVKYTYNSVGQRTVRGTGEDLWQYQYDYLGQVTNAVRRWTNNDAVHGQTYAYQFDDIGNRLTGTIKGGDFDSSPLITVASYNLLNQAITKTNPGAIPVTGYLTNSASLEVYRLQAGETNQQATPSVQGNYWAALAEFNNTNGPVLGVISNRAEITGSTNISVVKVLRPAKDEAPIYDEDGNLVEDSLWRYTWDAENRLVKIESQEDVPDESKRRILCTYDPQGRLVLREVYKWNATEEEWRLADRRLHQYDGWNCVAIYNLLLGQVETFAWGVDLSGNLQGAGGVGGLLQARLNGTNHFVVSDGNGNITALYDEAGTESARYEYGPFGELLRSTGPVSKLNRLRFSTKYTDDETDLVYYGFRYYNASTGRWLSRDPIGERGGKNLFNFVHNDPANAVDVLGLNGLSGVLGGIPTLTQAELDALVAGGQRILLTEMAIKGGIITLVAVEGVVAGYSITLTPTGQQMTDYVAELLVPDDDQITTPIVQTISAPGIPFTSTQLGSNFKCPCLPAGRGYINYGFIYGGRRSGVLAWVTEKYAQKNGSAASQSINPPGIGNGFDKYGNLIVRGHLWGRQNGGSGTVAENLVTMRHRPTNYKMRTQENKIRDALKAGKTVCGAVVPFYLPGKDVPAVIVMSAVDSDGNVLMAARLFGNAIGFYSY